MAPPRRQRSRWTLPTIAAFSLFASSAFAQPVDPRRRLARSAFEDALRAWREADYDRALAGFRRAQELSPHPATLYNVARAEERVGHTTAAIDDYEEYLREVPASPDADAVRATIATLRASLVVVPPTPVVTPPVVTPPLVVTVPVPPVVDVPRTVPSNYERILDRRRGRLASVRLGLVGGFAAPRDRQNVAVGLEATVFLWRSLTLIGHALWIQTDGSPLVVTGEAGWTFLGDDFDLAVLAHAGLLLRCDSVCRGNVGAVDATSVFIGGLTVKVDVLFHPRFSAGLYGRFSWQNLDLLNSGTFLSSIGLSVSFHL